MPVGGPGWDDGGGHCQDCHGVEHAFNKHRNADHMIVVAEDSAGVSGAATTRRPGELRACSVTKRGRKARPSGYRLP